jgi:hypothetical protein
VIKVKKYNNRNKNNNNRQNFDQKIKLKECKRIKIGKQRAIAYDSRKNNKTTETEFFIKKLNKNRVKNKLFTCSLTAETCWQPCSACWRLR